LEPAGAYVRDGEICGHPQVGQLARRHGGSHGQALVQGI
jgi:hypothetical protein